MGFRGMEAGHESRFNVHNPVAKEMVKTMARCPLLGGLLCGPAGWKTDIDHNI